MVGEGQTQHTEGKTMMPPTKDQADIGMEDVLVDCSASSTNKDTARQEFKDEADINYMLSRFGITQPRGTPPYGTWDDTIDLQSALQSVSDARAAFRTLPKELTQKFARMEDLLAALENGSIVIKDENAPEPELSQLDKLNARLAEAEKRLNTAPATP